jgi:hypothetical protein
MRIRLTPPTSEFYVLFGTAGENALACARLVERRIRDHPNSDVTQDQVMAIEMEAVTRLPAGDLIVFVLAGAIAAGAFLVRRYETRRLLPAAA